MGLEGVAQRVGVDLRPRRELQGDVVGGPEGRTSAHGTYCGAEAVADGGKRVTTGQQRVGGRRSGLLRRREPDDDARAVVRLLDADDLHGGGAGRLAHRVRYGRCVGAVRAGRALQEAFGVRQGAALTLEKNLPVSSGIGGGSADAAATLRLLAEHWGIDDDQERLAEVGLPVGADVPVCLASTTSRMTGIGEIVEQAGPLPPCGVVLVNGGEGVSTPSVFAARKGPYLKPPAWQTAHDFEGFARALKDRSNCLALAAQTVSPVISDVLTVLEETEGCALARVSGSGGTCFGLFADPTLAQAAAGDISTRYPQWWSVATRFRAGRPEITTG